MPSRPFRRFQRAAYRDGGVDLRWYLNVEDPPESIPVRIYRRRFPDFERPDGQEGFFDGLRPDDGDLLFEGDLERSGTKLSFRDESVEVYETYAYWVAGEDWDAPPLGPNPVRVRDHDVYWPLGEIESRIDALGDDPDVTITEHGRSAEYRPIRGVHAGNEDRCVAIVGLVHAGESGPELALPIVERLLDGRRDLLAEVGVAILPVANPDCRKRVVEGIPWYLRRNANHVDLNRNFDAGWEEVDLSYGLDSSDPDSFTYRGPAPESEPETRAVVSFVEATTPETVLATHYMGSICGAAMQAADEKEDDAYRDACRDIAEAYTEGMYGPDREVILRWVHSAGSLKTWLHEEYGTPGFALEDDGAQNSELGREDRTTTGLLDTYRDRHYGGVVSLLERLAEK